MATKEWLENRIAGKEKELKKLNKKMERILKAQSSNWENNPYYYSESDLRWAQNDIKDATSKLENYKKELIIFNEKANSHNIKVIVDFLENWKNAVRKFYSISFSKYLEERAEYRKRSHENCEWFNSGKARKLHQENKDEYNRINKEYNEYEKEFKKKWKFISCYVDRDTFNSVKFEKVLCADADAKYDDIIEKTNTIVGQITDASGLSIGDKGDLNGYIKGTRGIAKVQTIGAGGYNIQCYHFRTLIHKA